MKLPWRQWYPRDWLSDAELSACTPATRGIWKDWLDHMMINDVGELSGSVEALSRLGRCSEKQVRAALLELSVTGCGIVQKGNGVVTVISRRLKRESKKRVQTRLRVERHRRNAVGNGVGLEVSRSGNGVDTDKESDTESEGVGTPALGEVVSGEGRGARGEEKERIGAGMHGAYAPPGAEIPSVEEVVKVGGAMLQPAGAVDEGYCRWFHGKWEADGLWVRNGIRVDWTWHLGQWWRRDLASFRAGRHQASPIAESDDSGGKFIKNGGPARTGHGLPRWREAEVIEKELELHPCNRNSVAHSKNPTPEEVADWKRKRARLKELRGGGEH